MCIIQSNYLNSGFGAGNIFLNILLLPVNYILSSQHLYIKNIQCFIMAMSPNILILYVISSKPTMSINYIYLANYLYRKWSRTIVNLLFYCTSFVMFVCTYHQLFFLFIFISCILYIYKGLRAPRMMGECSLGLPS